MNVIFCIPASDTVSICGPPHTTEDNSHVYISSEGYPAPIPSNKDLDCGCTIHADSDTAQILDITAVHLNLYGNVVDQCRERLTLYSVYSKDAITICPTHTPTGAFSVTKINQTLLSTTLNRTQPVVIKLMTNKLSSTQRGTFLLSLRSQGINAYYLF